LRDIEDRTLASTLFHLLTEEEWQALSSRMEPRSFKPGDILIKQGTIEPPFHVIVEGVASIVATGNQGDRRELGRVGFGECVGEMSLLTGEPASADVAAVTELRTFAATPARLATLGELRTRLIEALSSTLAGRLKHANERLLALHPAREHLICCGPEDMAILAGLPAAMAGCGGTRVMALAADASIGGALQQRSSPTDRVAVRVMSKAENENLPTLLGRLAHDYDEIVVLGDEEGFHHIAPDASSVLHIARDVGGTFRDSRHRSGGQVVVISDDRWTEPALRQMTGRLGRPVVAMLPHEPPPPGGGDPVARLARVLTNRRVGLALGAGAAKGLAHLGVLRALDELAVPVDVVAGCSIGAAVAAGIAVGMTADELMEATARVAARAVRPTLPLRSFLSNEGIKSELKRLSGERRIEDLDLPLAVVATDLFRRSGVTFTSGLLWPRVLASMAIPGVYPPTAALGSYLVDGGVLNPVPVRQCRELGAGVVIGVRLTASHTSPRESLEEKPHRPFAVETIMRTFEIMLNRLSEMSHESADVNIEICIDGTGGVRDFQRGEEIAAAGYRSVFATKSELTAAMPYIGAGIA
jgi:NTE family protein